MAARTKRVRDLMTTEPFTLGRNDVLEIADQLMKQKRIRHIPILDQNGRLAGIVTQRDMFRGALVRALGFGSRAEEQMLSTLVIKEVMTDAVHTTTADTPLGEAAELMLEKQIGCLPVLEGNELVGILTESDFLRLAATS